MKQDFGGVRGTTRVWQLLGGLGFTPQRPTGRGAWERDEGRIDARKRKHRLWVKMSPEKDD